MVNASPVTTGGGPSVGLPVRFLQPARDSTASKSAIQTPNGTLRPTRGGGVSDFTQNNAVFINLLSIIILHNKKNQAVADISRKNRKLSSIISQTANNASDICCFCRFFSTKRRKAGRGAGRRITRIALSGGLCGFSQVKLKPPVRW
jgi:hypothetical protein